MLVRLTLAFFVASLVFAAAANAQDAPVSGDANAAALQKLAMRMAGPGPAKIYVGTLPDDWKAAAPLPNGATLVGSVEHG